MKFELDHNDSAIRITAYGKGRVEINHHPYEQSLVLTRDRILDDWRPQRPEELQPQDLEVLLNLDVELVVIGTGARLVFPPPSLLLPLQQAGIGVEVMPTSAACRCFTALSSEGRAVAVALMMIEEEDWD
ncbi:MAG: hypothetical protein D6786_02770 [Gammaproteobacteria bacterium]|nr:MAG: hypothetical protein D6786_02770 [Gammaproteobacteria bacterium]